MAYSRNRTETTTDFDENEVYNDDRIQLNIIPHTPISLSSSSSDLSSPTLLRPSTEDLPDFTLKTDQAISNVKVATLQQAKQLGRSLAASLINTANNLEETHISNDSPNYAVNFFSPAFYELL